VVNALRLLDRKLVRDLWHLRGPGLAIAVVTACGVASFVSLRSMQHHLRISQETYYARGRFADVFARVERAPRSVLREVASIPGITSVEARATADVNLDVPGLAEPAFGHLVGITVGREPALNRVFVRTGRPLAPGGRDEVLISEGFAVANGLAPGDSIEAVIGGRWKRLIIAGIALAPEYAYELRPGDLFPDPRRFGVLWMDADALSSAVGLQASWNDLAVSLAEDASEPAVIAALDRILDRYGSRGAYGRDLHISHRYLTNEIDQNRSISTIVPPIFLGVAAFLIHLVLTRVVASQREQIGMLKAYGFGAVQLGRHFVLLALAPVLVGTAGGWILGLWSAHGLAELYAQYFRIPEADFVARWDVLAAAAVISVVAAIVGAIDALRRVLRLPAAQAMRPEPPARFRAGFLERSGLAAALPPVARMIIRTVTRRPIRAALSILGLAFGVAVVIVGMFSYDSIEVIRRLSFFDAQRDDIAVTFARAQNNAALYALEKLPGVWRVEATRATPVRLRNANRERQVALVAASGDDELRRVVDDEGRPFPVERGGLLLSEALARLLDVGTGDSVRLEVLVGRQPVRVVLVRGLLPDLLGTTAYAAVEDFERWTGEPLAIDGAVLKVDARFVDSVNALLKRAPGVRGVAVRGAAIRSFDEAIDQSFNVTLITLIIFAGALAAGVAYNTVRIALAERGRDLASLRVLGFTRAEVSRMLFGEQGLLAVFAVPLGFVLGTGFAWLMIVSFESDLFRLPLVIRPRTYATAAAALLVSGVLAAMLVQRRLNRLDLVAVLKTRE
jgi:putative ABC transport system permease protein